MEGPQTRALADHLGDVLAGKAVDRILVPEDRWQANVLLLNCVGQVVQRVRSHGKWMFFDFSHGVTWMCQLITRAKWSLKAVQDYEDIEARLPRQRSEKRRRAALMRVYFRGRGAMPDLRPIGVIGKVMTASETLPHPETEMFEGPLVAILRGHPIFYIVPTENVRHHPEIKVLGPDPLSTTTFYDDFPYRLRQNPGRTLAAALLDQEVLAGLGNTLKCEILFAMRFAPTLRVGAMLASQVDQLAGTVVGLTATATTLHIKGEPYPYRVFDRAGLPCGICGNPIAVDRSGQDGHLTWYCPTCQGTGKEALLFGQT
jgi:formamidopyrimidine-DNA glycosylase